MFVADLHNDIVQRAMIGEDIAQHTGIGHSDLVRLRESCIDLEIFVVWASKTPPEGSAFMVANAMYDVIEDIAKKNDFINIPKNLNDITLNKKNNQLSIPIAMEGAEALENSLDKLHHFIERGVFYLGPTWNHSLDWVSSAYDEVHNKKNIRHLGLSKFGHEVIHTCNDNGVIIDVSHIGEKSFWDMAAISKKPFIASHSSVHKLCSHFRNLKDDQIIEIKKSQGLIGLNPYPFFIDSSFKKKEEEFLKKFKSELDQITHKQPNPPSAWIAKQHYLQKKLKNIVPLLDIFIDHIEYIIKLIGVDYVAIGSDYDGLNCLPRGWNDCLDHVKIVEALENRRYSAADIEKVMGQNILRVLDLMAN